MSNILTDFKKIIVDELERLKGGKIESFKEVDGNFEIKSSHAEGKINFYELDVLICEMSVTNSADGENKFYLHFELIDIETAKDNFKAMLKSLTEKDSETFLKVLFSCTGGLTTGYFAEKMTEVSSMLSRKFEFHAVPSTQLLEVGKDYDIILIAPQIGYELQKISNELPNSLVLKIPPKLFAAYDANELVKFFNWVSKYGV